MLQVHAWRSGVTLPHLHLLAFSIFIVALSRSFRHTQHMVYLVLPSTQSAFLRNAHPILHSVFKRFIFLVTERRPLQRRTHSRLRSRLRCPVASSRNRLIHHLLKWTFSLGPGRRAASSRCWLTTSTRCPLLTPDAVCYAGRWRQAEPEENTPTQGLLKAEEQPSKPGSEAKSVCILILDDGLWVPILLLQLTNRGAWRESPFLRAAFCCGAR